MWNSPLPTLLSQEDLWSIREGALRLLTEFGVACPQERHAKLLCERAGLTWKQGRLLFSRDAAEAFLERQRAEQSAAQPPESVPFSMGGSWNSLALCDPATNRPRPATTQEAERCARLSARLGAQGGPIPVTPGDVPERLRTLACEKIAVTQTPNLGGLLTATDPEEIRFIAAMHAAAGRRYTLGLEGLITPLRLNPAVLDTYFAWCDSPDIDLCIMGGIPVAGTTAPLPFPANIALSLAETIALDYIFCALSGGRHRCFNFRLEVGSMRNANLVFGAPEQCLFIQAMYEAAWGIFGIRPSAGSFRTNGKVVDAQTIMERTGVFLFQALFGARRFGSVGQLCLDEVFSPVQAILDGEILRYGARLAKGMPESCFDHETDIVELLREGEEEHSFLGHETTLFAFREMFDLGRMAQASFLSEWRAAGSKTLEELAWEKARPLMEPYFELESAARREVETLYRRALERFGG